MYLFNITKLTGNIPVRSEIFIDNIVLKITSENGEMRMDLTWEELNCVIETLLKKKDDDIEK